MSDDKIENKTIVFEGVVDPVTRLLYLDAPVGVRSPHGYSLTVNIRQSVLSIICRVDVFENNLATLKNYVQENVEALVDVISLQDLIALKVNITSATFEDTHELVVFDASEPLYESGGAPLPERPLFLVCDSFLAFALSDFREAMNKPHRTGAYCRRAIEAVANGFNDNKWKNCQAALNLKKETLEKHKDTIAHKLRHGAPVTQSWKERQEMLVIAREVIRRYMFYVENEKNELDQAKFPLY